MKSRMFGIRFLLISAIFLALLAMSATQSVAAKPQSSDSNLQLVDEVASPLARQNLDALVAQAQAKGSVRVIVGLRVTHQPEGRLRNSQAVQAQRAAIGQAQNNLLNQMASHSVGAVKKFAFIPYLAMQVDAADLAALSSSPNVASITENRLRRFTLAESVPLIGAPAAWSAGYTGNGQVVAILDTGVDKTHPFLLGKVVSEACYSHNYSGYSTSLCPGGVEQSTDSGSGINCSVALDQDCAHGTHVAGIAAGKDDGSIGFSGVAKDANIVSIQVYSYFAYCSCIMAFDDDIILGLERVQTLGGSLNIAAANLSLGGGRYYSQAACDADNLPTKAAIDNLRSLGIATAIASGNDYWSDSLEAPGCISSAISVGSTQDGSGGTTADVVSSFSDSASFLSLLAPGQVIRSSIPGGGYANMAGTSMATPHVAGAWAVLKSAVPSATVDRIFGALQATGKYITDSRNGITKPRIRVDGALYFLTGYLYYFPIVPKR